VEHGVSPVRDLSALKASLPILRRFVHVFCVAVLLSSMPSSARADTAASALSAMQEEDWVKARSLVQQSRQPVLAKMYEWVLYQDDFTGLPFERITAFLKNNPHWPGQEKIQASAERNMPPTYSAASRMAWFHTYPPVTGEGIAAMGDAYISSGRQKEFVPLLAKVWPKAEMSADLQKKLTTAYGSILSRDTHRRRIDELLFAQKYTLARTLAAQIGKGYPDLVEARISLAEMKPDVAFRLAKISSSLQTDPGLLYERLKWRRKKDQDAGAIEILDHAPEASLITNPEGWWKERNILARRMIEEKNFRAAYRLTSDHEMMDGSEYAEAEWLSGWLALRFLKNPQKAAEHFEGMYAKVKTAVSRSRGAYWAGRAAESMGRKDVAQKWFSQAASYTKTYYGQVAARHIGEKKLPPVPVMASAADEAAIANSDLFQAIVLTHAASFDGMRGRLVGALLNNISRPGEYKALAQQLAKMNLKSEALRVAKKAAGENLFLGGEGYPSITPLFSGLNVDMALGHAVIRQESLFDPRVKSSAGAMGLMQLMPGTAKEVAQKRGWDHRNEWLTSQPKHNVLLGSAYLNDLLERFGGSYPLAIAAYNAGPRNVWNWIEDFGDPRKGDVDWIDWIELIPIYETRNYVQRVMENYVVYSEYMGMKTASLQRR
jgi:soluble lytic murein transglycosylase